jgi:hypothetical protein
LITILIMAVKPSQLSDSSLAPFLQPNFDPAAYLNSTLPPLQTNQNSPNASSLADLSAQTQTLLASLNTQAARLTATLTQMTDEIIRSGSRLAYQVDVLRGEAVALNESLTERVAEDIQVFVPETPVPEENGEDTTLPVQPAEEGTLQVSQEPTSIQKLRLLLSVRERLNSVIKLFGAALAWPPPPAPSGAASFISVSSSPARDADAKAAAWLSAQKAELSSLVIEGQEDEARKRVSELYELSGIWKSAAEERGRIGVVAELENWIESAVKRRDGIEDREEDGPRVFLDGIYT